MKDPDSVSETLPKTNDSHRYINSGRFIINAVCKFTSMLGGMYLLLGEATFIIVKGLFTPDKQIGRSSLFAQMVRVGVRAIPIVFLVQMSIGMIVPLQIFPKLDEFGQGEQIATINAISGFREFGPLMTAVVLCGFAGASIAAELGTMVTSEEIEAL